MKDLIKKQYNGHKETIHNFTWRSLQVFGKQGITFLIFVLCARLLTPYDFGIYNYALAIIFFLVMFGDFGISTATSKYVAEYNITDRNKLRAVLFNSTLIIFVLTLIITVLAFTFGPWYLKDKYIYVLYLLPLIFLAPMTSLYDGVYRGLKRFKQLANISLLVGFLSVIPTYFLIKGYGLVGALISQNIFFFLLLMSLGFGYGGFSIKFNKDIIKEVGTYSTLYGLAVVGNYLFNRFGILILGHYGYVTEIATYELLNKFSLVLIIPLVMLGQVVAPNFTEMGVRGDYSKIYSKLKLYTVIFFCTGIITGILFYLLMPFVVVMYFGEYYGSLFFEMLPFLSVILMANVWAATVDAGILIPTGFANIMAKFYGVLGVLGCLLGIYLTHKIGYMGTIYSFTLSNVLMAVLMRIFLFKKINVLRDSP